jgi:hypothetical protein
LIPRNIGIACYFLILISVLLLILTLTATQEIYLLYFSRLNELNLQTQILLSLINSVLTVICSVSILKGYVLGRQVWHTWAVFYFFINAWQLHDRLYLIPGAAILIFSMLLLYGKPAQTFFAENRKVRPAGRRVDDSFNIFDED